MNVIYLEVVWCPIFALSFIPLRPDPFGLFGLGLLWELGRDTRFGSWILAKQAKLWCLFVWTCNLFVRDHDSSYLFGWLGCYSEVRVTIWMKISNLSFEIL